MKLGIVSAVLGALLLASPSLASDTWSELREQVFGDAVPVVNPEVVRLDAPYRTFNDPRTDIGTHVTAPFGEFIKTVTLIIDENPMPVSATFDLAEPQEAVRFGADMRFNGPSPLRAVVETVDGRLLMVETLVKTSGVGACAAPPIGNPEEAIAKIGGMDAETLGPAVSQAGVKPMVELGMSHPQHTGMQMDQITLHYILARFVDKVDVASEGTKLFTLTGSISLSEDPAIRFELPDASHMRLHVRMKDTSDTVVERDLSLFPEG